MDTGQLGEERLEQGDFAATERLNEKIRSDCPGVCQRLGEPRRLALLLGGQHAGIAHARLERVVDIARSDRKIGEDVRTQGSRDPPVHPAGQLGRKVPTMQQRVLVGVDPLRLLDEIVHRRAGDLRAVVLQQRLDDVDCAGLHQRVADLLAHRLAHGDRKLMLERALLDDLYEFVVVQHLAMDEDLVGDGYLVFGKREDEVGRRVRLEGESFGERAAHRGFGIVDQLPQDLGHQGALAIGQDIALGEK